MKRSVLLGLWLLVFCVLGIPGLLAFEDIPAAWFGPDGESDAWALKSRSTAAQDAVNPKQGFTPSPADWRDRNIYQLFTDRFATDGVDRLAGYKPGWKSEPVSYPFNRNFHHGGSWKGLQQQIPYLKGMGITAVWISGVQQNDQGKDTRFTPYHQYHAENFFRCDPAMGTFADLTELINALHAAGMSVILDVAPNHMCDKNGMPNDADDKKYWPSGNGTFNWFNSSNKHWTPFDNLEYFHNNGTINNWDQSPENLQGQFKGTDDLKSTHGEVTAILTKAFKNLMDATDCDGFRVDAIKHMPYSWCRDWADQMLQHAKWRGKDNFLMFGELFVYNNQQLGEWCRDGYGFNSALLFPLMQAMDNAFGHGYSGYQLGQEIDQIAGNYGQGATRAIAFLDNHDVDRFARKFAANDTAKAKRLMAPAMTFLYLAPPVPLLYYGTEHMFDQGGHANGSDRNADNNPDDGDWQRETMFNKGFQPGNAAGDMFTDAMKNRGLYHHIAWLNSMRNKSRALRRGGFAQRAYQNGQGVYAFTKWYDTEVALIIVNTADGSQSLGTITVGKADSRFYENGDTSSGSVMSDGSGKINFGSTTIEGKGSKVYICNPVDNSADIGGGVTTTPWIRGTHAYPAADAEEGSPIFVNTEVGPADNIKTVEIVYAFNPTSGADWQTMPMMLNSEWDSDGGAWYNIAFSNPVKGTLEFVIAMTPIAGDQVWDNNSAQNYSIAISEKTTPQEIEFAAVSSFPTEPMPDGSVTITASITYDVGVNDSELACGIGYAVNPAAGVAWPVYPMTRQHSTTNGAIVVTYFDFTLSALASGATIHFYLEASNGGEKIYANNGGKDYQIRVQTWNLPAGLVITAPVGGSATTDSASYTIQGTAGENLISPISWSSSAASGTFELNRYWSFAAQLLPGSNPFTFSAPIGAWVKHTLANDSATNYATWAAGANGGTGFGAWAINATTGESGNFLDDARFGLWSHQKNLVEVIRPFAAPLNDGDVFEVRFQNGWVVAATEGEGFAKGSVGVALRDAAGSTLWELYFNGGDANYGLTDVADSGIGWTDAGLDIRLELTSASSYQVAITPVGGETRTFVGALPAAVAQFRVWSYSNRNPSNEGTPYNVFFANPKISREAFEASGETSTKNVVLFYETGVGPYIGSGGNVVMVGNGFRFTPEAGYTVGTVKYATDLMAGFTNTATIEIVDGVATIRAPNAPPNAYFKVWFEEK